MGGVVFVNADQLPLGDLYVGQVPSSQFGQELAVGHLLGSTLGNPGVDEINGQNQQGDVYRRKRPTVLLLPLHTAVFCIPVTMDMVRVEDFMAVLHVRSRSRGCAI